MIVYSILCHKLSYLQKIASLLPYTHHTHHHPLHHPLRMLITIISPPSITSPHPPTSHSILSPQLAAELGADAVSHLEEVSSTGVEALAQAGTVAVLLPTTAYILRLRPPPARKMIEKGDTAASFTGLHSALSWEGLVIWTTTEIFIIPFSSCMEFCRCCSCSGQ